MARTPTISLRKPSLYVFTKFHAFVRLQLKRSSRNYVEKWALGYKDGWQLINESVSGKNTGLCIDRSSSFIFLCVTFPPSNETLLKIVERKDLNDVLLYLHFLWSRKNGGIVWQKCWPRWNNQSFLLKTEMTASWTRKRFQLIWCYISAVCQVDLAHSTKCVYFRNLEL